MPSEEGLNLFSIHLFSIVKFISYKSNYKHSKTINGQLAKTINGRFARMITMA